MLYKSIRSFASDITWDGMGKGEKYVCDHFNFFTHISGLKMSKMCKIITISLISKKQGDNQGYNRNPNPIE
jgi:hypothetical protein